MEKYKHVKIIFETEMNSEFSNNEIEEMFRDAIYAYRDMRTNKNPLLPLFSKTTKIKVE